MDLDEIRNLTVTAGPHVGDLLWWALEGARIRRADLEGVWLAAGLSAKHLPQAPTPEKALKTAVRDAQLGAGDHLIRLGKETKQEVVFAVLHETRDLTGNVTHSQVARIELQRGGSGYLRSDNDSHEVVSAVRAGFDRMLYTHTVDDVRRMVVRSLDDCAAVTLRDNGGVYWVPAQHSDTVHRLQSAIAGIGKSRLDIVPVHATPEGTAALGHAAHESIEAEITTLRTEIASFVSDPPEQTSTLMRRLERFESLKQKAQLYHSVLQVQVQDLEDDLSELAQTVRRLLSGDTQAPLVGHAA